MSDVILKPDELAATVEAPTDGSETPDPLLRRRTRKSRLTSQMQMPDEPSPEERAALRRTARRLFRLYCFSCGRSTEASAAPTQPQRDRCPVCGGTMLLELVAE